AAQIRDRSTWKNIPEYHKECAWTTVPCNHCGTGIRAHRSWDNPPKFCDGCKSRFKTKSETCTHCSKSFEIPTGTQIRCAEKGWELPNKCSDCRELFKHKPFYTKTEEDWLGRTVFRTYNKRGDLISESRDEEDWLGRDRRRHKSKQGTTTGFTRDREDWLGREYKETRDTKGNPKSKSRKKEDWLGREYVESENARGEKSSKTRKETDWLGRPRRRTD
ncbi:hypothetical protein PVW46_16810, partial [Mameliella sp. AT18]|uniref:hypothetical protein n=1 Tax=Mameliella sp. AT18 TaxID=3028385 RepID=UPI00237A7AF9